MTVHRARALALALALAAGCAATSGPGRGAGAGEPAAGWSTPRLSINRRAIYASGELAGLAEALLGQLAGGAAGRTPRVAFYYFTLGGARHHLGESVAQDLASQMVRRAAGRAEFYTRRKLTRVMEEQAFQGTELVDETTLVHVGRASGVDAIVSGRLVLRADEELALNCQVLDLASGRIQGGGRLHISLEPVTTLEPVERLDDAAARAARDLAEALEGAPHRLAVYDVTRSREDFAQGRELAEAIGTELALRGPPGLETLTRSALAQVMEEQALELTEGFDETTRTEIARLAGADVILTGFGEIYRDLYVFNVQVLDVETARILAAVPLLVAR
ncbi:MAG: hypothetical protein HY722_05055 [Planctomycetes bacterium]|nr:hypothetical protein [Planctomycetota bacterium]